MSTFYVVVPTENVIVVFPLWSDQVCLCEDQGHAHQQQEDWANNTGKSSVCVWYKTPGET